MTRFIIYVVVFFACIVILHWAIYKLTIWRRGKPQAKAALFSMITLTFSLIFSVGVAEIGCRVWFKDISSTGDNSSYFAQRWRKTVQRNTLGFREQEFELDINPNVFRIAVVGDSFAFGQGLSRSQRFSNIIEKEFNKKEFPTQVLNFGKSGTDTIDQLEILEKFVVPTNPDFILLQWYINDVKVQINATSQQKRKYYRLIPSKTITRTLHKHSALYFLVDKLWKKTQESLGLVENYQTWLIENLQDPNTEAVQRANNAIIEFIKICKRESIPVGIVLFPQFSESLREDYTLDFLSMRVLSQCQTEQIMCIDLKNTYSKVDPISLLWVNQFDHHPSALANKLAAKQIIDNFGAQWLSSNRKF